MARLLLWFRASFTIEEEVLSECKSEAAATVILLWSKSQDLCL